MQGWPLGGVVPERIRWDVPTCRANVLQATYFAGDLVLPKYRAVPSPGPEERWPYKFAGAG